MPSSILLFVFCLYGIVHFHNDFKFDPDAYLKHMARIAERYDNDNTIRKFGNMPFMMMFLMHDEKRLRWILESGAIDVNHVSHKGYSALHVAAYMGDIDAIDLLTKFNVNLDVRAFDGTTPLLLAVSQNHSEVARYLIDSGSDVRIPDNFGITPLKMAIRKNFSQIISLIIGHKTGTLPTRHELDAMHFAAKYGYFLPGHSLIENGYDINRLINGESPLHVAITNGRTSFAELLLTSGAKCDIPNRSGNTALHLAVVKRSVEMVKALLKFQCDPYAKDMFGRTPLYLAMGSKDLQLLRISRVLRRKGT